MTASRRIVSALLVAAFALAAGLSAAPKLHDWLHKAGDRSNHECAATLMSSGSVEHSSCEPVSVEPKPAPTVAPFRTQFLSRGLAALEFSLLEHAPPANS